MENELDYLATIQPLSLAIRSKEKNIIQSAIDDTLPNFAEANMKTAIWFARATLDDIRQGNHPEMEKPLRAKIQELGIDLSL